MNIDLPNIMYRGDAHIYYILGAYAGLHYSSMEIERSSRLMTFVTGLLGFILSIIFWESRLCVVMLSLCSIGMTIGIYQALSKRNRLNKLYDIAVSNTFIYYTHFFFIGGIKKAIGIIFRKSSLNGFFWCSVAFVTSTIICVIIIIILRKVLLLLTSKIAKKKVKQLIAVLIP